MYKVAREKENDREEVLSLNGAVVTNEALIYDAEAMRE